MGRRKRKIIYIKLIIFLFYCSFIKPISTETRESILKFIKDEIRFFIPKRPIEISNLVLFCTSFIYGIFLYKNFVLKKEKELNDKKNEILKKNRQIFNDESNELNKLLEKVLLKNKDSKKEIKDIKENIFFMKNYQKETDCLNKKMQNIQGLLEENVCLDCNDNHGCEKSIFQIKTAGIRKKQ